MREPYLKWLPAWRWHERAGETTLHSESDILFNKRSPVLSEQVPSQLAENLQVFKTPAAVDEYSVYRLDPEEKYLFAKYYKPGDTILDLACGLGRTTLLLYEMGLSVRGLDASEVFINTARRRLPYLDLRVGSYDRIEEPDSAFSHVLISFNGIDYAFPESQRVVALRECARVLKPGGTLIYSSHNIKSLHLFSPRYRYRVLWKLRNSLRAFRQRAYVLEAGLHTLYTSREFVIGQTEQVGLKFLEMVWFRMFGNERIDRYFSPYIHYVFAKPNNQPRS
jgi:ubiquinone/menaquinone biosynthesis C-methylase UbiE